MTKNKNILSTLMIALLLSACGSSSSDKEKSNSVKADEAIMQETKSNNTQQEVTKLVATPINASDDLKGQTVEDLNVVVYSF